MIDENILATARHAQYAVVGRHRERINSAPDTACLPITRRPWLPHVRFGSGP
jgi:hypothetical protein